MDTQQVLNFLSVISCALGALCLGKGFWPPKEKFTLQKETTMRGGKVIEEKPAIVINELVSDDEVPEEIKRTYSSNDLLLYKSLLKKSKDLINIKFWGCVGTGFVLLGCILAGIAVFIQKQ